MIKQEVEALRLEAQGYLDFGREEYVDHFARIVLRLCEWH